MSSDNIPLPGWPIAGEGSRKILQRLEALNLELLRGEEPMPQGLSSLQEELWRTARAERLAIASQLELKRRWEGAVLAAHLPHYRNDISPLILPMGFIEGVLAPMAAERHLNPEDFVRQPGFIELLDVELLSRLLDEEAARRALEVDFPARQGELAPRLSRDFDQEEEGGDDGHQDLFALAILLNPRLRIALCQQLHFHFAPDEAGGVLLRAGDLLAREPERVELRNWCLGAGEALQYFGSIAG